MGIQFPLLLSFTNCTFIYIFVVVVVVVVHW